MYFNEDNKSRNLINIISMIDIIFTILSFFIIYSLFLVRIDSFKVILSESSTAISEKINR